MTLAQAVALGALVGLPCGAASALFLWLLDLATGLREAHPGLVFALPPAGLLLGWVLHRVGRPIEGGTSLVIDALRPGGPRVPLRMAPLVLGGTLWTHLFGGSAGREGAAVQVGAALTDGLCRLLRTPESLRRPLLAAGVAGGFGSVFGTPLAGAVFAVEFLSPGRLWLGALAPALAAAFVGDATSRALGITHAGFPALAPTSLSLLVCLKWLAFAAVVAAVAVAFVALTHAVRRLARSRAPSPPLRLFAGGLAVVALWEVVGTGDYLGLGVPGILRAFSDPALPPSAFALKLLFTAVTVGAGFVGGEVTPLFFVGASLGNVLARVLGLPLDLGAGVGLAAAFAAASHAPLALALMAAELLGLAVLPHAMLACVVAHLLAGRRGLYPTQWPPGPPGVTSGP